MYHPFGSPNGQCVEVLPLLFLLLHDLLNPLLQGDAQVVDFGVVGKKLSQHYQTIPNLTMFTFHNYKINAVMLVRAI